MDEQNTNTQINSNEPVPQTVSTDEVTVETTIPNEDELKKKMEAILAMEGEEGRQRRELAEKERQEAGMIDALKEEEGRINLSLKEINKTKEDLELKWIDLSDKKNGLQKLLEPIAATETVIEKNVQAKNQEEHATEDPAIRQALEKERQALEAERQRTEKDKWVIEDKMSELNALMIENKSKYQKLLDEEYVLIDKTKEIEEKIKSIKVV